MPEFTEEIDGFFATSAAGRDRQKSDSAGDRARRLLRSISGRAKAIDLMFGRVDAFRSYIDRRPDAAAVRQRMTTAVAKLAPMIADTGSAPDREILAAGDIDAQYRGLVMRGLVEPSLVFDDIPETPLLCSFKEMSDFLKLGQVQMSEIEGQQFRQEWTRAIKLFNTRWTRLTGQPFDGNIPGLEALMRRKAPVPTRPAWLDSLSSREARALNAEPSARPPDRSSGGSGATMRSEVSEGENADDDAIGSTEPDDERATADPTQPCLADNLLRRAGIPPLAVPADNEPRYTFPGTLLQREDIFYDYGLIVPVEECGPLAAQIAGREMRSVAPVQAVAGEVVTTLKFIGDLGLAAAFGELPGGLVADRLHADIDQFLITVDENTPLETVQSWKQRLAEWATLVREAARRRLFMSRLAGRDPRDFLNDLSAAIANVPPMQIFQEDRISYNQVPEGTDLANYLEINGLRIGNVRDVHGNMSIDENDQVRNLRRYLEYIAGDFYARLQQLIQTASDMRDAVRSFQGNAQQVQQDFENLAAGTLNDAASVLAQLLEDMVSQLPLWSEEWAEGSKRLGMLVIFRQYWTPEGYVKGKLVGYKNLIPDQRERIRRRTFVRTLTEQVTTQEFARTSQQDFSRTQRETSEVTKESAQKFNMAVSASGSFNFLIGSVSVTTNTGFELSSMSRSTQTSLAEASMKSSVSYNEKREVKIREETETQEEFESVTELHNPNQEITANYFYYQLLRQYLVSVEFHDVRPVLLRTRHVPSESAIGDKLLADYAHILINELPAQLADDLRETVNEIDGMARRLGITRTRFNDDQRAYEDVLRSARPSDPDQARERDDRLAQMQETARASFGAFVAQDETYSKARVRLDRVVEHVRSNRCHYMQFIWQASPTTDFDRILRTESFGGIPLPELTRGLQRQGYFGNEEIFDFTGPSWALADALTRVLTPGSEFASLPDDVLRQTSLFQQLARYYSDEELDDLLQQIRSQTFVTDPANRSSVLSNRRVQIAQDALVVETLPGRVPLLEGFKAAHRMLDIERACLENDHLRARISDRPWRDRGEDSYRVYRREGEPLPVREAEPREAPPAT